MSRFPLAIERYMSTVLIVVGPSQPLSEAIRLMRLHDVRHLPVVTKSRIAGLISQRDIYLMQSIEHSDPSRVLVSEAMTSDPYTVEPDEPVDHVAREMVRRRIGSALVTHGNRLLGLFTASDALLALAAFVEDERMPGEDQILATVAAPAVKTTRKRATKSAPKRRKVLRRAKAAR